MLLDKEIIMIINNLQLKITEFKLETWGWGGSGIPYTGLCTNKIVTWGGGGRLCPKGVPFLGWRFINGSGEFKKII